MGFSFFMQNFLIPPKGTNNTFRSAAFLKYIVIFFPQGGADINLPVIVSKIARGMPVSHRVFEHSRTPLAKKQRKRKGYQLICKQES